MDGNSRWSDKGIALMSSFYFISLLKWHSPARCHFLILCSPDLSRMKCSYVKLRSISGEGHFCQYTPNRVVVIKAAPGEETIRTYLEIKLVQFYERISMMDAAINPPRQKATPRKSCPLSSPPFLNSTNLPVNHLLSCRSGFLRNCTFVFVLRNLSPESYFLKITIVRLLSWW